MPRLETPPDAVTVRMYRQGHGDCFLLAFPRPGADPVYVLIDCGYKPGSQRFVHGRSIQDTVDHIHDATGGHLDLFVVTHEHQDHVNGIWKENDPYFQDFTIEEAWFAWTENPADEQANELRRRHRDQLLGLVAARMQLATALGADDPVVGRLDALLSLEAGGEDEAFSLERFQAAADPSRSDNKQAMKLVKDKAAARNGVRYVEPGQRLNLPGAAGFVAYVLGPPRDEDLLSDENPVGSEAFPDSDGVGHGLSFAAAAQEEAAQRIAPFAERYQIPLDRGLMDAFFRRHYGGPDREQPGEPGDRVVDNAQFRRIDAEWLYAAENMAIKLNSGINNTSVVLAFELPRSGKVLLFAADAQRGNWVSWNDKPYKDLEREVTARDLLARTVLYKVGHHGSHNATLDGKPDSDYANLSWMGLGSAANEFTAMITAVNEWALTKNDPPWRHPLPSIRAALLAKTQGRLFQTDTPPGELAAELSQAERESFQSRTVTDELYFDYVIPDS